MTRHLTTLTLSAVLTLTGSSVFAANCAKRDQIVDRLQSKYTETLTGRGIQGSNDKTMILEIWASPETGTYTVLLTSAQGISCVMAAGTHWFNEPMEEVAELKKGTPS